MSATPGPWEVSGGGIWAISPWNARVRIASVLTFSPMNGLDSEANGRLIAAAPDMAAAITTLRGWVQHWTEDRASGLAPTAESLAAATACADAALAQAGAS